MMFNLCDSVALWKGECLRLSVMENQVCGGSLKFISEVWYHARGTYKCQVKRGLMNGFGRYTSSRGNTCVGEWREDVSMATESFRGRRVAVFAGNCDNGEPRHGELTKCGMTEHCTGEVRALAEDEVLVCAFVASDVAVKFK
jgi:hypothetical protein